MGEQSKCNQTTPERKKNAFAWNCKSKKGKRLGECGCGKEMLGKLAADPKRMTL
jgi:hypothetical protein